MRKYFFLTENYTVKIYYTIPRDWDDYRSTEYDQYKLHFLAEAASEEDALKIVEALSDG
jgi:hypothetical protein